MRLRFSIHDLLWLTLVVAILVAWWLDHKPQRYEIDDFIAPNPPSDKVLVDHSTGKIRFIGPPFNFEEKKR